MHDFSGKSVLVTGGTKGVGLGICQAFLATGATVYTCGRTAPAQLPGETDNQARFVSVDVRQPDATQQLISQIVQETGRLDILINNAGGSPPVAAADASPRLTESIIRLNLIAPMILAQQTYSAMIANRQGGTIINIASVSGIRPSPGTTAYGAAKAGLINATRSLAQEWGVDNIRVNAIIAGLIRTEAAEEHYAGAQGIALIEANLPMRRMALPDDIAQACLFLASPQASYISGAALEIHGGGEPPSFLALAQQAWAQQLP
jgi:NAD(P)-dependent dehydrogenase (short-subunit alcohol dehydrogenase family)